MEFLGECFGVKVQPREKYSPFVTLFVEDDGNWSEVTHFDSAWLGDLINVLTLAKNNLPRKEGSDDGN